MPDINITDEGGRLITLSVMDADVVRASIAADPALTDKKGEALAAAIVETFPGDVCEIFRTTNGVKNDGPNGEPAHVRYNEAGKATHIAHYINGKLSDTPDGAAAVLDYDSTGRWLRHMTHCKNDLFNDARDHTPALQDFNEKGDVIRASRWKNGTFIEQVAGPGDADLLERLRNIQPPKP